MGQGVDWINLSRERHKWIDIANKKLMFLVPQNARYYFIGSETLSSPRSSPRRGFSCENISYIVDMLK